MSARQLRSHADIHLGFARVHARILGGLAAALVLCEIASRASVTPSIVGGGLGPLLALPFFGPSLLGAFAAQILLRPGRAEILTSIGVALLAAVPIFLAASGTYAIVNTA